MAMIVFSRMMSIQSNDYVSNNTTPQSNNDDVLLFEEDIPTYSETQSQIASTLDEVRSFNQDSYVNEVALEIERARTFSVIPLMNVKVNLRESL